MNRKWMTRHPAHLYGLAVLIIITILLGSTVEARIYKWVDEKGKLHYSDTPPAGIVFDDEKPKTETKKSQPTGSGTFVIEREAGESIYNVPMKVDVSGTVRNQSGNSVDDVVMTVKVRHYPGKSFEPETSYEKKKINGAFRVVCKNCEIPSLTFRKNGYLHAAIKLKPTKEEKGRMSKLLARQVTSQKSGKSPAKADSLNIVRKDLKVVLIPENNGVYLVRLDPRLSIPGDTTLLAFAKIPALLRARGGNFSYASNMIRAAEEAPESLKITVNSSPNLISDVEQDFAAGIPFYKSGVKVYLDFSHADGGVVEVHPKSLGISDNLARMTEAPKTGYKSRLLLRPDASRNSTTTYFYFRFGGFYGKGIARPLYLDIDPKGQNTRVSTTFELYFNPEGGRTLLSR